MENIMISEAVAQKLRVKHGITEKEVLECFENDETGSHFEDERAEHKTVPPTFWFISMTNTDRQLKIVYVHYPDEPPCIVIKSAFEPSPQALLLYNLLVANLNSPPSKEQP